MGRGGVGWALGPWGAWGCPSAVPGPPGPPLGPPLGMFSFLVEPSVIVIVIQINLCCITGEDMG